MREEKGIFYRIDWILVVLYLTLVIIGWLNVYAAVYDETHRNIVDLHQRYGKQMIFILAAILLAMITLLLDPKFFSQFAYFIYGFCILLLIVVIFGGKEISGSKSWFQIAGLGIQPAEFAKMATCLVLAKYLSALDVDIRKIRTMIMSAFLILFPVFLVILQHDLGSAIVFLSLIIVLYRSGRPGFIPLILILLPFLGVLALVVPKLILSGILLFTSVVFYLYSKKKMRHILIIGLAFLLSVGYVYSVDYTVKKFLKPHQRERIQVLLGINTDLKGAGYNVNQSLIAIGSGGFAGKGFLKGTQTKYNFVPEQSTDFIFCTIGEEWGFLGSVVVIALLTGLCIRIIRIADRQRSRFSRLYGYGVASILFIHFAINIGMTLGIIPVIGIPLPFISYGGSSLWAFTLLLFIFIRQDCYRSELI